MPANCSISSINPLFYIFCKKQMTQKVPLEPVSF